MSTVYCITLKFLKHFLFPYVNYNEGKNLLWYQVFPLPTQVTWLEYAYTSAASALSSVRAASFSIITSLRAV